VKQIKLIMSSYDHLMMQAKYVFDCYPIYVTFKKKCVAFLQNNSINLEGKIEAYYFETTEDQ